MSDYQAVYDAAFQVLRRVDLSGVVGENVERAFSSAGHVAHQAALEALYAAYEMRRPSVLWRPKVFVDGDHWCALYGENLQDGVAGFGDSPESAMTAFDAAWSAKIQP